MDSKTQHEIETTEADAGGLSTSDARLVEEARRGDQSAFRELVQRYERRLLRVIYRFVHDRELARDLAQETFLRVYERLDKFDTGRRFGPWLFRVGINLTVDYLRKSKRRIRWSQFGAHSKAELADRRTADPRKTLELQQEVWAVARQLPEKYRTVLILRDLESFSTSEVAAMLNRKEATIRWRLAEARDRFERLWRQRQEDQGRSAPRTRDDER